MAFVFILRTCVNKHTPDAVAWRVTWPDYLPSDPIESQQRIPKRLPRQQQQKAWHSRIRAWVCCSDSAHWGFIKHPDAAELHLDCHTAWYHIFKQVQDLLLWIRGAALQGYGVLVGCWVAMPTRLETLLTHTEEEVWVCVGHFAPVMLTLRVLNNIMKGTKSLNQLT